MGVSTSDYITIGLPIDSPDAYTALIVDSAFDWLKQNTILEFDIEDVNSLKALPAVAKLFVMKFTDVMKLTTGVSSEQIDTLSHSFEDNKGVLIQQYAFELLSGYLKSGVTVFPAKRKW